MKGQYAPEPHRLDGYRRRKRMPIWKVRQILLEDYGFSISEGKLSRVFGLIDPMEPELESLLKEILIGADQHSTLNNHGEKGEKNE